MNIIIIIIFKMTKSPKENKKLEGNSLRPLKTNSLFQLQSFYKSSVKSNQMNSEKFRPEGTTAET